MRPAPDASPLLTVQSQTDNAWSRSVRSTVRRSSFDLDRGEWWFLASVVAVLVVIDKLVVQDHGSTWASLVLVSGAIGLGLIHGRRWLRRRHIAGRR
jgi:hypothetical protein